MSEGAQKQLQGMSVLLALEKRARSAESLDELGYIIVNETRNLVAFDTGMLWIESDAGKGRLQAVSDVPLIEKNTTCILWANSLYPTIRTTTAHEPARLSKEALKLDSAQREGWEQWMGIHVLRVPLLHPSGRMPGILVLGREQPWNDYEIHLLKHLCEGYGFAWQALQPPRSRLFSGQWFGKRRGVQFGMLLLSAALLLPVRLSVLAPGVVVPHDPWVVRAPAAGVIQQLHVKPNEEVKAGQPLLSLDPVKVESDYKVATQKLMVAEAEYRQAAQKAMFDSESKNRLKILQGKKSLLETELAYLKNVLGRLEVKAAQSGVAILDDESQWLGRPVAIGEKILSIADPDQVRVQAFVSVQDAISLQSGAELRLFLASDPTTAYRAVVERADYQPQKTTEGVMAYRVLARLDDGETIPRIGLSGTAKIYGEPVLLGYYLFRRPLAVLRQWLGW